MKRLSVLIGLLAVLAGCGGSGGLKEVTPPPVPQDRTVTGTVVDPDYRQPVDLVQVTVLGQPGSVAYTNAEGRFSIEVPPGDQRLRFEKQINGILYRTEVRVVGSFPDSGDMGQVIVVSGF